MSSLRSVYFLFLKELNQEVKQQNATLVILLYVLCSVFVSYLSFKRILSINTWNALYWIIVLFGSFNATLRVFDKESDGRHLFLSQLAKPIEIFFAKSLFASILSSLVGLIGFATFYFLMGLPVDSFSITQLSWFLLVVFLGGFGLGSLLVLINGIAFKSGNSIGLASILGLPIAVPLMIILIRVSQHILANQPLQVFSKYILSLLTLDLIILGLASLLFPYLWRD